MDLGGHGTIEQQLRLEQKGSTLVQNRFKTDGIPVISEMAVRLCGFLRKLELQYENKYQLNFAYSRIEIC